MYKKAIAKVNNKIFAKKVLSVMKRAEETKHAQPLQNLQGLPLLAYGGTSTPTASSYIDLTTVFNTIQQGTGQGDRIGNRITPTRFVFSGFMNFNADIGGAGDNSQPQYVKMFIFRMKNTVSATAPDMTKFFQYGSTSQAPTGYIQDIKNRVNLDDIVLYTTRLFKLSPSAIPNTTGVIGAAFTNNDYKLTQAFKIDLTKHIKKAVYDDQTAQLKNHQMFCAFVFGMNTCEEVKKYQPDGELHTPIQIAYTIECAYKDD